MLLELLLADSGIAPSGIPGYESAEFTHAAVAAYVASGMADASFGVEMAARRFDLDFIPLVREEYFFAIRSRERGMPALESAISVMAGEEFRRTVNQLAGYDGSRSGSFIELDTATKDTRD